MKKRPRLEAGEVVGEEEYKRIIAELDEMREHGWRCPYQSNLPTSQKQKQPHKKRK